MAKTLLALIEGIGQAEYRHVGAIERVCEGAGRRLAIGPIRGGGGGCGRGGSERVSTAGAGGRERDGRGPYDDAVFAVVDAAAVGQDVDVGALGTELAVSLQHVCVSWHRMEWMDWGSGR